MYWLSDDERDFYKISGTPTALKTTGALLMSRARGVVKCDLLKGGKRVETCNARGHWTAVTG